ncbi:MAG: hypothetical protein KKA07_08485 [Bacteroidetes bacterium]|nr:hypothetical protein [Bacteroidota bacterium]MBU1719098.1 hypothetical protein [Bacteroidota bacterium]
MKSAKIILTILSFVLSANLVVFAQSNILKKMNFKKANWKFFGIIMPDIYDPIQDSLGNFFTNDKELLELIKKAWKLEKHDGSYMCGYNYRFVFIHKNAVKDEFFLNMECKEICGKSGCFEFPKEMLLQFFPQLISVPVARLSIDSLQTARNLFQNLSDVDSVMIISPESSYWTIYQGVMKVEVLDSIVDSYTRIDNYVIKKIKKDCSKEKFAISKGSSGYLPNGIARYDYYIYCSQSMASNFRTYRIKEPWKPFSKIPIEVYGLNEEQVIGLINSLK